MEWKGIEKDDRYWAGGNGEERRGKSGDGENLLGSHKDNLLEEGCWIGRIYGCEIVWCQRKSRIQLHRWTRHHLSSGGMVFHLGDLK